MRSIAERNELVEKNTGLVALCVKKLNFGRYDDDLFQVGCLGLIRAAELYDETLGFKFSTYAANCIEKRIMTEIYRKRRKIWDNEISGDMPILDANTTVFDIVGDSSNFTEDLIDKIAVEQVVSMLSENEKRIFELTKDGRSQKEIAEIFNMSQPHISRIIKRIIKTFQDAIINTKVSNV